MDTNNLKTYVIVQCIELGDQYECDADRIPTLVLINVEPSALKEFQCYGFEIYVADGNGELSLIQDYNDYEPTES